MFQISDSKKYAVTGALAGLANGFFGAGGGLFLVPLFIRWIKISEQEAFATSVFVVLPMCISSVFVYSLNGGINFNYAYPYLIGGFFGGILAGFLFKRVPTSLLRRAFGALLIYGGIRAVLLI
ncbi:MAG: sulfite exporter TauE/SafE family protein [Clostridiales bacterium]|nr:sulfite exporter TauE/SafE family protein [Clostridiales bacterium]